MEYIFILFVFGVAFALMLAPISMRNVDHIFSPFPGFVLIFSLYYMLGAWSVASVFPAGRLPVDRLWTVFTLCLIGFSLTAHPATQRFLQMGFNRHFSSKIADREDGKEFFYKSFNGVFIAILWIISVLITGFLWAKSGIPIFSDNVDAARVEVASNGYLGTLAASLDVASLFCILFIISATGKKKDWRFWLSIIVISTFVVVAVLSGSRSRIFKLIVPAVTAYHFAKRPISGKTILAALPIGIFLIGFLGYYRAYSRWGSSLSQGLPSTVGDDTYSQILYFAKVELSTAIYGLLNVIDLFPNKVPYTFGWLHLGPILNPFQIRIPIPGNYFKELVGGTWDGVGLAATFIAPMYAELGVVGVLILSMLYGLIVGRLYSRLLVNSDFRYYRVGTYSIFFYIMLSAMRSDFISFDVIWFIALSASIRFARLSSRTP